MKSILVFCGIVILFMVGCEEKRVPVVVTEWNEFRDPAYGYRIKYPNEWKQFGTAGKAVFAKSQEVLNKFLDPTSGIPGAQANVDVLPYGEGDATTLIQTSKDELRAQNAEISPDQVVTIAGKEVTMIPYRIQATTKTSIHGHQVLVAGDTAMYRLVFEGYGGEYDLHKSVFEEMEQSFELPVIVRKTETWQPSPNMETFSTQFFVLTYPDNMVFVNRPKGTNDLVVELRADRLDCSIRMDVFGAKELTVDKVWEQNKGKYRAKATGTTTIDGEKTYWVDYSLVKDVNSRAYFTVKNDKVIRTTINYYAPQKDVYFPTLENMVKSLKLK